MNPDGTLGTQILATSRQGGLYYEDLDYYDPQSFLGVGYKSQIYTVDRVTGQYNTLVNVGISQFTNLSGVAVASPLVLEPGTMLLLGRGVLGLVALGRKKLSRK